ncbi:MAG TPA: sigma-70 family RNA polymerase sigma factor [Planctomycetota bacterium]|nr:sigma-70 family RNA polymerase sigma factor [Planctomycetota bacterium]
MTGDALTAEAAGHLERWRTTRDPEALGWLLKWQRDRAYATAFRILNNSTDAEDAVQQAFVKLLSRTHGFETSDLFRVTVYRAVVQCALDMARANRARLNLEKAMTPLERNAAPTPQLAAEQAEALRMAWQELQSMPEETRALVVLCYQEGLSVSDAAEVLNEPRETLRDRLSGAMNELRRRLNQRGIRLSLITLIALLGSDKALAAPAHLCEALDTVLPGPSCAQVAAAKTPAVSAEAAAHALGSSGTVLSLAAKVGIAASILLVAGSFVTLRSTPAPATYAAVATPDSSTVINFPQTRENAASVPVTVPAAAPEAVAAPAAAPHAEPNAAARAAKEKRAGQKNEDLPLDQVPVEVREAGERALNGFRLVKAERKTTATGVLFELEGYAGGKFYEIFVDANGNVRSVNLEDDEAEKAEKKKKTKAVKSPASAVKPPAPPTGDF